MRQLKRQDRTKDMHLERKKKEISVEESPTIMSEKPNLKWRQTEDKVETTTIIESPLNLKSRDKVESQPRTQPETKWRQTEDKVETKLVLSSLVGLQRNLAILIYQSCKSARSSVTDPLTIEYISKACETSASSAKKTIQRLEQKGVLTRVSFKDGRGGWTTYELEKSIYQDLLRAETEDKLETKWRQTEDKVGTQLETQPRTTSLVSKLDNINTNLTNTDSVWNLNMLEHVEKYGINSGVIKRAREISPNLEIDQVCNVIEKFMLCMEGAASKEIKNKIAFFLSLTKKAASGEEILPEIETETDKLMREMVIKAQKALKDRAEMEEQLLEVSFQEWLGSLSPAERLEIAPSSTLVKEGSHPHTQQFKNYYRENLWSQHKQIMLQGKT